MFILFLFAAMLMVPFSSISATSNSDVTIQEELDNVKHNKAKSYTDDQLDKILTKKLKFPDDVVEQLSRSAKEDFVNNNAKHLSFKVKHYKQNSDGSLDEINSTNGEFTTMGTIPSDRLTLITGRTALSTQNGADRYLFYSEAEWSSDYAYDYTDQLAISYSDDFEADEYTDGGYYCKHYNVVTNGTLSSCGGNPGTIDQSGASWSVDIHNGKIDGVYASLKVQENDLKNEGIRTTGNIISKYAHKTGIPGGISVSIGWASISNESSGHDEMADQEVFYYYD